MSELDHLLLTSIAWQKISPGKWTARVNAVEYTLRMNDFPDEPLYTVSSKRLSLTIDDAPKQWKIEQ